LNYKFPVLLMQALTDPFNIPKHYRSVEHICIIHDKEGASYFSQQMYNRIAHGPLVGAYTAYAGTS
jgi:hypothetical protein